MESEDPLFAHLRDASDVMTILYKRKPDQQFHEILSDEHDDLLLRPDWSLHVPGQRVSAIDEPGSDLIYRVHWCKARVPGTGCCDRAAFVRTEAGEKVLLPEIVHWVGELSFYRDDRLTQGNAS
jgi:hypothetical protein